jgi:hypothetical protein
MGSATQAGAPVSSGNALKATKIGGATVITNATAFTLYWFAPDTPAPNSSASSGGGGYGY